MAAIAISAQDEKMVEALKRELNIPSKSQVIHRALQELQKMTARISLAREIDRSAKKCSAADMQENEWLGGAAIFKADKKI